MLLNDNFHPFLVNTEFSFQKEFECYFTIIFKFYLSVIKLYELRRKSDRNDEPGMLLPLYFLVGILNKTNSSKKYP